LYLSRFPLGNPFCGLNAQYRSKLMKIKIIATILLVTFFLYACAPAATPAAIQPPAAVEASTSVPSATIAPIPPTATIAPTLIPSPTVEVMLADLPQTKVAVDQFAAAMKEAGIQLDAVQIRQGLTIKEITGKDGGWIVGRSNRKKAPRYNKFTKRSSPTI
jgi:hypothetical protein